MFVDRYARAARLEGLTSETRYLVCVLGLGNWMAANSTLPLQQQRQERREQLRGPAAVDTQSSRCAEVKTLEGDAAYYADERHAGSILTRRLGLIVGSCLGCVVFVVLVSVLGYMKVRKQRADTKREQPLPPEYLSYRHFSLHAADHAAATMPPPPSSVSGATIATTVH